VSGIAQVQSFTFFATLAGSFFNFRIWWLALAWLLEETVRYGILFWVPLLLDGIISGNFNGKSAVTSLGESSHPLSP
jgi:hypothetical protein